MSALDALAAARIVPVVVIDDAGAASDVVDALAAGGIPCVEITLRTSAGLVAIAAVSDRSDVVIGAGTVLEPDDVDRCVDAGARFIVSPGFDREVVDRALARGVAVLPGVATPSEIQAAVRAGLDAVKVFPADRLGGLPTISAFAAPFPRMRFLPSGGVTAKNAVEYLRHPSVFAVGGSWMVPRDAIAARDGDRIRLLSRAAVDLVSA